MAHDTGPANPHCLQQLVVDYETLEVLRFTDVEAETYLAERPDNWVYLADVPLLNELESALAEVQKAFQRVEGVLSKAGIKFGKPPEALG